MTQLWWRMVFRLHDSGRERIYLEGNECPIVPYTAENRVPRNLVTGGASVGADFDMVEALPTRTINENGQDIQVVTIVVQEAE